MAVLCVFKSIILFSKNSVPGCTEIDIFISILISKFISFLNEFQPFFFSVKI